MTLRTVWEWITYRQPPCCCPVGFRGYIEGDRCPRHLESTEVERRA